MSLNGLKYSCDKNRKSLFAGYMVTNIDKGFAVLIDLIPFSFIKYRSWMILGIDRLHM